MYTLTPAIPDEEFLNIDKIMNMLKILIIGLILYWLYKKMFCTQENFAFSGSDVNDYYAYVTDKNIDQQQSMFEMLTANCDPKYCNTTGWSESNKDLPKDTVLTSYSTSSGCCIVPKKFKDLLEVRFNNAKDLQNNFKDSGFQTIIKN